MRTPTLVLILALGTLGCTEKKEQPAEELTRRERDSIIGESALPGAQGVRGALRAADSADARARRAAEIR